MKFKYLVAILLVTFLSLNLTQAAAKAPKNQLPVKVGDTAYVCECGSKCGCETAGMKPGKCGCGHDLAKVSVTKVKGSKAYYQGADGKEKAFKLAGKYTCGCGGECCQVVSNKPGKCACGKDLIPSKT
jgi:hypothetical protein